MGRNKTNQRASGVRSLTGCFSPTRGHTQNCTVLVWAARLGFKTHRRRQKVPEYMTVILGRQPES